MRQFWTINLLLLLPIFFLYGCENDTSNGDFEGTGPVVTDMTCLGCHSDQEMLEESLGGKTQASSKTQASKVKVGHKGDG